MKKVELKSKRLILDDFFKVEEIILRNEKFDRTMSEQKRLLNFERGDSVAAILFKKDTKEVILVHQFKYSTYEKDGGWILEIIAGMLGKNEEPEEGIRREIFEEVGYNVLSLEYVSMFYVSPGSSSERIILYYAETESSHKVHSGGGISSEHEDIKVLEFSIEELLKMLKEGRIKDAKTIIAIMWLKQKLEGYK